MYIKNNLKYVLAVLLALFVVVSFVAYRKGPDQSLLTNVLTVKQATTIVANGNPVKWIKFVKLSDVTKDKHLVKLPKHADNVSVELVSQESMEKTLSSKQEGQLSLNQKVKIATANRENPLLLASIFDGISKFFISSVEEAVEVAKDLVDQDKEVQKTKDAIVVDLEKSIEKEQEKQEKREEKEEKTSSLNENIIEAQQLIDSQEYPQEQQDSLEFAVDTALDVVNSESPAQEELDSVNAIVEETIDEVLSSDQQSVDEQVAKVEYETPAPEITEHNTDTGKTVTISSLDESPDQPQLTDVLAFTTIPEIFRVGQEDKIKIKWKNNDNREVTFHAYDTDYNGKLDYVEWTVPHLSEQIFEIIFISKAFRLDENQEILEDIYDTVKIQDNRWVSLEDGQYVRATFEQILDNTKDNTIYARPTDPNSPAQIDVYPVYTDENGNTIHGPLVATFENIDHEATYKVLLTNLQTPTDVFDLKIKGNIDIDYIVDPSDISTGLVAHYKMNDNAASTTVIDNTGTYNGTAARNTNLLATSKINSALSFNGSTDKIDESTLDFSGWTDLSFSVWIKMNTAPFGGNHSVMIADGAGNGYSSISLMNAYDQDGYFKARVFNGDVKISSGITQYKWHHVVVAGTKNGTAKMYLDGAEVATGTYGNVTPVTGFKLGGVGTGYPFNGNMDDFRLYNRVLSAGDASSLYNSGAGTESEAGALGTNLVVHYKMNDTSVGYTVYGSPSPDATGHYIADGTYNGATAYRREDSSYWLWQYAEGQNTWMISSGKGVTTGAKWYDIDYGTTLPYEGEYVAQGDAEGSAWVEN